MWGAIGLFPHGPAEAGVGYWVTREGAWPGGGHPRPAIVAAWAFASLPLARLELTVIPGNDASMRVAEKAGFQRRVCCATRSTNGAPVGDAWMFARLPSDPVTDDI